MKDKKISMAVIRRLPKYSRYLKELMDNGVFRISSKELSEIIGFTASQIRQDLNNFGGFGQQGYGYNVEELYREINKILGIDKSYKAVVIGAGNMGQALANYPWLEDKNFKIESLFDVNPRLIGLKMRDLEIRDIEDLITFVDKNEVSIAIICTPKEYAQDIADKLAKTAIKGIWNFAPIDIDVPENIVVENVHLSESLFVLSYLLDKNS